MDRPHPLRVLRRLASRLRGEPAAAPSPARAEPPAALSGLPPLQPGRGETPGPNHKADISREWASAQLLSGVPPFFLDLRSAEEHAAAHLPGALSAPGWEIRDRLGELPPCEQRLAVYDRDGLQESAELAAWLRAQGWVLARRLAGGFEGWRVAGEPLEAASDPDGPAS